MISKTVITRSILFSLTCLSLTSPAFSKDLSDREMFEICSSKMTRAIEDVLGNSTNRIAYPHWHVERDGKKANVITNVELGPVLRAELVCYFKNGKMVDVSITDKTGGMTDYEKLQQDHMVKRLLQHELRTLA